jgi:hypothetical protein
MKNQIMKKSVTAICIVSIGLMILVGCAQKNVEGVVISVPMSMSFNEMMSGNVENMTFSGDVIRVKLENGEEIDALATHEQMEQAFNGKTKATLAKAKDKEHEDIEWKVISLEENTKKP